LTVHLSSYNIQRKLETHNNISLEPFNVEEYVDKRWFLFMLSLPKKEVDFRFAIHGIVWFRIKCLNQGVYVFLLSFQYEVLRRRESVLSRFLYECSHQQCHGNVLIERPVNRYDMELGVDSPYGVCELLWRILSLSGSKRSAISGRVTDRGVYLRS